MHPDLSTWLDVAQEIDLALLLTSRWAIPQWEGKHRLLYPLLKPRYGDFLRFIQNFHKGWDRKLLPQIYQALGGNFKGVELFSQLGEIGVEFG